jgi:hypothetical protein
MVKRHVNFLIGVGRGNSRVAYFDAFRKRGAHLDLELLQASVAALPIAAS